MRKICLTLICLFTTLSAWAAFAVNAQVDKTNLTLDDELTLTIQITGANGRVDTPQLPSLPSFNVYSREMNQSSINGNTTLIYRYTMLPRLVGNATIGAISVNYQGKTYQTEPIEIHIYRDGSPARPANPATTQAAATGQNTSNYDSSLSTVTVEQADPSLPLLERTLANQAYNRGQRETFFLISAVSNNNPYVNEPFTLAVRFYYAQAFQDNAPYQKPSVTNLFMEEMGSSEGSQKINGRYFHYMEQRYQLAAAAAGQATIGPASVEFVTGNSAFALLDRMFGGVSGSRENVQSAPIRLNVRAVPSAGKPTSFYGTIGSGFVISAKAEPTTVEAGEPVNVSVTVQGPGNLKTTHDLQFPPLTGFKIFPAASSSGQMPNNKNRSYKIFKTVLIPSASGIYTIPPLEWSYFDPAANAYKTIHTKPISLTVTPSTKVNRGVDFGAVLPTDNGVQALGKNIRYLKTPPAPKPFFLARLSAWPQINALVLILLAISVFMASVGKKFSTQKQAYASAKSRLLKAASTQQIADALADYVAQKFNIHLTSTPLKEALLALHQKGINTTLTDQFAALWKELDAARFAPTQGENSLKQFAATALTLLKQLEAYK